MNLFNLVLEYPDHNLQALGMSKFTLNELTLLKKVTLKGIVKEACKKSAKQYLLNEIKEKDMSKVKNLKYNKFQIQPYLISNNISLQKKKILFKARTNMLNVKWNFGDKALLSIMQIK